jgi:hypothetical protein
MGIDLFLEKPNSSKEIAFLLDCIESLLDREQVGGFRGIQSKSLVDIIQLECLSQNSSVLKITQGAVEGKIWIQNGEIVDAAANDVTGVEAFHHILSWKTGSFELLPADPGRSRTIFTSYQGLLLETAQLQDEALSQASAADTSEAPAPRAEKGLAALSRFHGVEFVLSVSSQDGSQFDAWGVDNPEQLAKWAQNAMQGFRALGETLQAGMLSRVEGQGPMQKLSAASRAERDLCVGFYRSLPTDTMRRTMDDVLAKWAS